MIGEGLLGPVGGACEGIVVRIVVTEVIGELATDNEFFKE